MEGTERQVFVSCEELGCMSLIARHYTRGSFRRFGAWTSMMHAQPLLDALSDPAVCNSATELVCD